ncbi:MAG: phosphoenolpyruvate synthase [Rhodoferax sp.]|nr:phosphoenolpyruvate synthase [Rhodoferax sp.]
MAVPSSSNKFIVPFEGLRRGDCATVGLKVANLGEVMASLSAHVKVPPGFAVTVHACREFFHFAGLADRIREKLLGIGTTPEDVRALAQAGAEIRAMVADQPFPPVLESEIRAAFSSLRAGRLDASFAVRASATLESLPILDGCQNTFLNVAGEDAILWGVRSAFSSLYGDQAIRLGLGRGLDSTLPDVGVGIQRMVRSDVGVAGVMFTIDPDSGFSDVVFITSSYGLGEAVEQGAVDPDGFYVHKPMLRAGKRSVIRRNLGSKLVQMQAAAHGGLVSMGDVPTELRNRYSLVDAEVEQLARDALLIEAHYACPVRIEWARDGVDGHFYVLQAQPEVRTGKLGNRVRYSYQHKHSSEALVRGRAIGQKVATGPVCVLHHMDELDKLQVGDVLVTDRTDPAWEPAIRRAAALVTNRGGGTSHGAIMARELGIPAVVGCHGATHVLKDGMLVTVACTPQEGDTGFIYDGLMEAEVAEPVPASMPTCPVQIMVNVGNPRLAFDYCQLPNAGVGLARLEFIINKDIGVHPRAILDYPNVDASLKKAVESVAHGHASPRAFYADRVAEGVATIAAAFWPKPVIVRLSDFKSNEYRTLIGGNRYERKEENPMLGFRGVTRYLSAEFGEAFALECAALQRVRGAMGLVNVQVMVPFVRTLGQARKVTELLAFHGLRRGENGLKLIMMCELPSNAILADEFLQYFDGFSIGTNDLTQLALGLDRDSGMPLLADDFDERDPAVKALISLAIEACKRQGKSIGICGQGPSDYPDFARWLVAQGISSISLDPDSVLATWRMLAE